MENSHLKKSFSNYWIILYGVLIGLICAGVLMFFINPRKEFSIQLHPSPTAAPVFVEVDGAVQNPGLYQLNADARVNDAINLAGGFLEDADTLALNLAMPIYDGLQIIVFSKTTVQADHQADHQDANTTSPTEFININFADRETLCQLPSIGESKAQAIIDYREEHGYFKSTDEIVNVPGIGDGIFETISHLITIY